MKPTTRRISPATVERQAIRRRVRQMYNSFADEGWEKCFSLVDPRLRKKATVQFPAYADGLRAFKGIYGSVRPWMIKINLHLDMAASQRDTRQFAYVYVIWQDDANRFHMFQERWVKECGHWYTRVAGLVPADQIGYGQSKRRTPR